MEFNETILHHPDVQTEFDFMLFGELVSKNYKSPKEADPKLLWAMLRTKYRDGDQLVDSESLIWDVWRKDDGYALYCKETEDVVEVPRPKM
tara:strand:+ start:2253 stop:2525 length:273 start_codon:yes stop_codon:yes gene_type:complete